MVLKELKEELKNISILIVEDGEDISNIMSRTFKMIMNNISLASNGIEALEKINESKHDIILTDLRMPYKNGIELINEVRKTDTKTPIIVITAYENDLDKETKKKVNAIFSKPINFIELIKIISKLTRN